MNEKSKERLTDLLADQATQGLSAEELAELDRLQEKYGDWDDLQSFEITAAAVNLLGAKTDEPPKMIRGAKASLNWPNGRDDHDAEKDEADESGILKACLYKIR